MARKRGSRAPARARTLSSPATAVMKAFRRAKSSAPRFMSTCGIFPEVSELASDRLHAIVHDIATRQLGKGRHLRALQKRIRQLTMAKGNRNAQEVLDRVGSELTALLASEATAAYLFGLSVGMTVRSLPERLDR